MVKAKARLTEVQVRACNALASQLRDRAEDLRASLVKVAVEKGDVEPAVLEKKLARLAELSEAAGKFYGLASVPATSLDHLNRFLYKDLTDYARATPRFRQRDDSSYVTTLTEEPSEEEKAEIEARVARTSDPEEFATGINLYEDALNRSAKGLSFIASALVRKLCEGYSWNLESFFCDVADSYEEIGFLRSLQMVREGEPMSPAWMRERFAESADRLTGRAKTRLTTGEEWLSGF